VRHGHPEPLRDLALGQVVHEAQRERLALAGIERAPGAVDYRASASVTSAGVRSRMAAIWSVRVCAPGRDGSPLAVRLDAPKLRHDAFEAQRSYIYAPPRACDLRVYASGGPKILGIGALEGQGGRPRDRLNRRRGSFSTSVRSTIVARRLGRMSVSPTPHRPHAGIVRRGGRTATRPVRGACGAGPGWSRPRAFQGRVPQGLPVPQRSRSLRRRAPTVPQAARARVASGGARPRCLRRRAPAVPAAPRPGPVRSPRAARRTRGRRPILPGRCALRRGHGRCARRRRTRSARARPAR
jgi:hypothetical protein